MKIQLCYILLTIISSTAAFSPGNQFRNQHTPKKLWTQLFESYDENSYEEGGSSSASSSRRVSRPKRMRPIRVNVERKETQTRREEAQRRHKETLKDPTLLTNKKFSDRKDVHPASKRAIQEVMGLQSMTEIQAKTYAAVLAGESVLGRARTGTGKTLAFLLPTIERLLEADLDIYKPGRNIGAIIIAPTRELAIQIADEAEALLTFHNDMDVACFYGGTKLQRDYRLLSGPRMPTILVATPGRILEHMENSRIGRRKFKDIAEETRILVLDEADRLFDSFSRETKKILSYLPRTEKRQTLLFSATFSRKLLGYLKQTLKMKLTEVSCVDKKSIKSETNMRVDQKYIVLQSMESYVATLVAIIQKTIQQDGNHKVLVFFPASKLVRYFSKLFTVGLEIPVLEIHSRMSQSSRNRASNAFRTAKRGVLFTSDVSARGVDYPDVSLVVQYGAPSTQDDYIHRLGRTGRAGSQGEGLLVLMPFEKKQLKTARCRGVKEDLALVDFLSSGALTDTDETVESVRLQVRSGHSVLSPSAEAAYRAFLAYYVAQAASVSLERIVEFAKEFGLSTGLPELPPIDTKVASRLGVADLIETSVET